MRLRGKKAVTNHSIIEVTRSKVTANYWTTPNKTRTDRSLMLSYRRMLESTSMDFFFAQIRPGFGTGLSR